VLCLHPHLWTSLLLFVYPFEAAFLSSVSAYPALSLPTILWKKKACRRWPPPTPLPLTPSLPLSPLDTS
jgi:hypothetical protein